MVLPGQGPHSFEDEAAGPAILNAYLALGGNGSAARGQAGSSGSVDTSSCPRSRHHAGTSYAAAGSSESSSTRLPAGNRAATPAGETRLLLDKSVGALLRQWGG